MVNPVSKRRRLGPFEQQLLYAILRLRDGAYGMRLCQEVEERTGEPVSVGAAYATLDRLAKKGYVTSRLGEPTPERGGRAKRFFSVTGAGAVALQEPERAVGALRNLV